MNRQRPKKMLKVVLRNRYKALHLCFLLLFCFVYPFHAFFHKSIVSSGFAQGESTHLSSKITCYEDHHIPGHNEGEQHSHDSENDHCYLELINVDSHTHAVAEEISSLYLKETLLYKSFINTYLNQIPFHFSKRAPPLA